jgi:hypothetical protein
MSKQGLDRRTHYESTATDTSDMFRPLGDMVEDGELDAITVIECPVADLSCLIMTPNQTHSFFKNRLHLGAFAWCAVKAERHG